MNDNIFRDLAAPIPASDIKSKTLGNRRITFINARVVMNRLDKVVGPGNWRDEYQEVSEGVVCTLYIRIGDEWVGKSDVGDKDGANYSPFKGMYSDAFKRAAVRWGIGRELYGDGTAYDDDPAPAPTQARKTAPPARASAPRAATPPATAPDAAADDMTLDDVVLVSRNSWGSISRRLVNKGYVNATDHAWNTLKLIAAEKIVGFNPERAFDTIDVQEWTEAELIEMFKARKANS